MNTKRIICITGRRDRGKTSIAALIYQQLVGKAYIPQVGFETSGFKGYEASDRKYSEMNKVQDFISIIPYMGHSVGFISAGDPGTNLMLKIKIFIELGVEVIICCARTGRVGSSQNQIYAEFEDWKNNDIKGPSIIKEHKLQNYQGSGIYSSKESLVNKIVAEVNEVLNVGIDEQPEEDSVLDNKDYEFIKDLAEVLRPKDIYIRFSTLISIMSDNERYEYGSERAMARGIGATYRKLVEAGRQDLAVAVAETFMNKYRQYAFDQNDKELCH